MNIFYDHDRDYAEIFVRREHNYGEAASDDVSTMSKRARLLKKPFSLACSLMPRLGLPCWV